LRKKTGGLNMKKLVSILFIILLFISACAGGLGGIKTKPITPCVVELQDGRQVEFNALCEQIKAEGGTSYICDLQEKYSVDPCYIHRGMEVAAKEGLVLEGYTAQDFDKWANSVKEKVQAGLTYGDLRTIILAQFTKVNRMLGAQVLILGDMFLELPQNTVIPQNDIEIVLSSINDLVKEVKRLDIWLQ
jgi:hypothetical protein